MSLDTHQVIIGGKCDWCPNMFDEGDFVATLPDDTLMCPNCAQDMRELEATS